MADNKNMTQVPEILLKKRKRREDRARKAKDAVLNKKRYSEKRTVFKRAEKFIKEYRLKEHDAIRMSRNAKKVDNHYLPAQPKLAFVMRIGGTSSIHPRPRKVMELLRLQDINTAVFVKLNKATLKLLKIAEPYIAWGYPNLKSVRELIYKRGNCKVDNGRVPLTDNLVVEKNLGSKGLICIEDLIHEIYTVGPNFKQASNFLWPFRLQTPVGGWKKQKYNHFNDVGCREDRINQLLRKII